jgi:hypothetical protein
MGLFLIASISVFAQNPQTGRTRPAYTHDAADVTVTGADIATVGAQMPYRVTPDAFFSSRPAIFNASIFSWTADNSAAIAQTQLVASPGYYAENQISVTMPATPGTVNISVAEMSQPIAGSGCVDATPEQIAVTVVAKPTLAIVQAAGTLSGCAITANQNIDVTFSGTAPFYVNYTITYTDWTGTASAPVAYTATVNGGEEFIVGPEQLASGQGTYSINISDVWDSNSYRAINRAAINTAYVDRIFDIQLFPTPTTAPIQHLQTL